MLTCVSSSFIITTFDSQRGRIKGIYGGGRGRGTQVERQQVLELPWEGRLLMKWSTLRLRLEISESRLVNLNYSGSTDRNLGNFSSCSSLSALLSFSPAPDQPYSSSSFSSSSSSSSPSPSSQSSSSSPSSSSSSSQSASSSSSSSSSSSALFSSSSSLIIFKLQVSNMNIYSIKQQGQALQEIGLVIDTSQRLKLELALIRLSQLANADQLLFWGKITTTSTPYYIALALDFKGHYSFPHKKFYYSTDKFVFNELPALDQYHRQHASNYNTTPFTGSPQNVLLNVQGEGESQPPQKNADEDSEEENEVKVVPKNYTEEDRLAYTVHAIEQECQLSPIGAFKMITSHQIRYNDEFKGIKASQFSLASFSHFRYPSNIQARQKIESAEAIFQYDLFDPVQNPFFWSAQPNLSQTLGTVRSFLWPGYIAYSFFNKSTFGGVYYGNGLKQVELPFYL